MIQVPSKLSIIKWLLFRRSWLLVDFNSVVDFHKLHCCFCGYLWFLLAHVLNGRLFLFRGAWISVFSSPSTWSSGIENVSGLISGIVNCSLWASCVLCFCCCMWGGQSTWECLFSTWSHTLSKLISWGIQPRLATSCMRLSLGLDI